MVMIYSHICKLQFLVQTNTSSTVNIGWCRYSHQYSTDPSIYLCTFVRRLTPLHPMGNRLTSGIAYLKRNCRCTQYISQCIVQVSLTCLPIIICSLTMKTNYRYWYVKSGRSSQTDYRLLLDIICQFS